MTLAQGDEAGFAALTAKIARERGFGTANYKDSCLRRRIAARMRAMGAPDYHTYSRVLDDEPAEYERLLDALTINVTKLFRDPPAWHAVERTVLGPLWALPHRVLRCWVAGCASGEEAYTLAALWHRFAAARGEAARAGRVHILASDIDRASLEAAERGAYATAALAEAPADVRARYFSSEAPHEASRELKAMVRFERRDLLQDAAPAGAFQLITCRNVIIYFDRASQETLMRRFHRALAPGGFLVLGKVETLLGPARALFDACDQRQRIFRRP
ncbi:MAG TPA: protein-glutamate O-methyltransferase CheR [Gemmatimonadaceae bacterium]|nr:protein-glutamate O-methyltransferase CheR [Gemmatimonadaceae bacterium]